MWEIHTHTHTRTLMKMKNKMNFKWFIRIYTALKTIIAIPNFNSCLWQPTCVHWPCNHGVSTGIGGPEKCSWLASFAQCLGNYWASGPLCFHFAMAFQKTLTTVLLSDQLKAPPVIPPSPFVRHSSPSSVIPPLVPQSLWRRVAFVISGDDNVTEPLWSCNGDWQKV